jgi:hypothetical protein
MTPRAKWIAVASAVAVFSIVAYGSRLPQQPQQAGDRRESFASSTGPLSPSVIGSWTAHGADDGPIVVTRSPAIEVAGRGGRITAVAPPGSIPKGLLDGDRVLDILVLWRWPGEAPEISESGGNDVTPTGPVLHRFVAGGREFRVEHNRQQGTVVVDGTVVPLEGANVLMLDVEDTRVRVSGLATVDPRFPRPGDPAQMVMARSPTVMAFVSGGR